MKKITLLLLCSAIFFLGCGFIKIGDPVPELARGHWFGGSPLKIKDQKGKKMVAVLFWQPNSSGVRSVQLFARLSVTLRKFPVAFAAIGKGSARELMKLPLANRQGNIAMLADVNGNNMTRLLRKENRLPSAILIGKDGKLLWRGSPGKLHKVINAVEKKQYKKSDAQHDDEFNAAFTGMITRSDFKGALKLLETELSRKNVNHREIVSLQVGIHFRRLNSAEGALAVLHKAQKRFPGDPSYYEMELKLLELGNMSRKTGEFYYRLAAIFKNNPKVLLKFVTYEMNRPMDRMNPANIYVVARAAANAGRYQDKKEQGRALIYYAQSLYCLGRVDLALKVAERSLKYLKNTAEYKQASDVAGFYRKLAEFSPGIKE